MSVMYVLVLGASD